MNAVSADFRGDERGNPNMRKTVIAFAAFVMLSDAATAQAPSASPEALAAAKEFIEAWSKPALIDFNSIDVEEITDLLVPMLYPRKLDASTRRDIAVHVAKTAATRLRQLPLGAVTRNAASLSADDLNAFAAFLDRPSVRKATEAHQRTQATGKVAAAQAQTLFAMKDFSTFLQTPSGRRVAEVMRSNMSSGQGAWVQQLSAKSQVIGEELEKELKRRGLRP